MQSEKRIALVGIIVDDFSASTAMNAILHEYAAYVVGRMGVPMQSRGISVLSVVLDAPSDVINSLGGRLGRVAGISVKTQMARAPKGEKGESSE